MNRGAGRAVNVVEKERPPMGMGPDLDPRTDSGIEGDDEVGSDDD